MENTNLKDETIEFIESIGKTPEDIIFIGSEQTGHRCTWDQFLILSDKEYDSGYGGTEVATDLIIVFSDYTRMFRSSYDGSEWWDYIPLFQIPTCTFLEIDNIFCDNFPTIPVADLEVHEG